MGVVVKRPTRHTLEEVPLVIATMEPTRLSAPSR
jgi:hypothetical protein